MFNFSFREKSTLGSLIILVGISTYYFAQVFKTVGDGPAVYELAGLGISLLVCLVILEIAFHAIIAAATPTEANEASDERDRLIAAKAGRNGGVALASGAFLIVGHIMGNSLVGYGEWITPFITANLILLAMVVAQVVEYVSQLIYYRRGS